MVGRSLIHSIPQQSPDLSPLKENYQRMRKDVGVRMRVFYQILSFLSWHHGKLIVLSRKLCPRTISSQQLSLHPWDERVWLPFAQILQFLSNIRRKTFRLGDVVDIESERDGWEGSVARRLVRGKDCIEGSQQIAVSTKREGGIMWGAVEGMAEYLQQFSKVDRAVTYLQWFFLKWKEHRTSQWWGWLYLANAVAPFTKQQDNTQSSFSNWPASASGYWVENARLLT